MDSHQLTLQETQRINQALNLKMEELDRCLERAGKMLSQISDYPVFTAASTVDKVTVKRYDLLMVEENALPFCQLLKIFIPRSYICKGLNGCYMFKIIHYSQGENP